MGTAQVQGPLWGAAAAGLGELAEPSRSPSSRPRSTRSASRMARDCSTPAAAPGSRSRWRAERARSSRGLDASAGLLAVARERLPEADLREGELEALPYADDSFDAVTAFNSVQYASDPTAALREISGSPGPGARVAITTWGSPEQCEMRAVLGAIGSLLPPPPPGAAGPFALAAPGALEALVKAAGLTAERAIDVPTPYAHGDVDTAVRAHLASGPARRAIETAGLEATRDALAAVCEEARREDGSVRFDNVFKVLIARA